MTTDAPDAAEQVVLDFLRTATPQQRYTFVRRTSDDGVLDHLRVVLGDPTTGRATALAAYWMLGAGYDTRYATADEALDHERPTWELLRTVEDRYVDGFYADHGIAFDPSDDEGDDWTADDEGDAPVARPVPAEMLRAVDGEPVDEDDTEDGLPLDVHERHMELLD